MSAEEYYQRSEAALQKANAYSEKGNYEKAEEFYAKAERALQKANTLAEKN